MALKVLLLRNKLDMKQKALEELREKDVDFQIREKELETAISEMTAETPEEDRKTIEKKTEEFQADANAHSEAKKALEEEISGIEEEIRQEEEKEPVVVEPEKRKDGRVKNMENRTKFFGMAPQERDAFFAREDIKDFLQRAREAAKQTRAVTGAELLIPSVVFDLVKENVLKYSKLYKHVNVRSVPGKARQNVMGTVPEAVWTEMCATLNELSITFSAVEVDGYKVGGFIAICNATLEDSDIALATEIISALGQAIGVALDKAILYGTGTKMPLGIVTRLTQKEAPADYSVKARPWVDLSSTNVLAISGKTDAALFKALVEASGAAKGVYSRGEKFWVMNEKTYTTLIANALTINAAGAITAGIDKTMPVIGGAIEVLPFIPDSVVIGGYGDLYLLAERAGATVSRSEHVRYIEDQTVFKGTARYDGIPVIAEGFVAIGINGTAPAANAVTFTADTANTSSNE